MVGVGVPSGDETGGSEGVGVGLEPGWAVWFPGDAGVTVAVPSGPWVGGGASGVWVGVAASVLEGVASGGGGMVGVEVAVPSPSGVAGDASSGAPVRDAVGVATLLSGSPGVAVGLAGGGVVDRAEPVGLGVRVNPEEEGVGVESSCRSLLGRVLEDVGCISDLLTSIGSTTRLQTCPRSFMENRRSKVLAVTLTAVALRRGGVKSCPVCSGMHVGDSCLGRKGRLPRGEGSVH